MKTAGTITTLCLIALAAPASARERPLAPTSDWSLQQNAEDCTLVRTFADREGKTVRLSLQSFGSDSSFRVTMVGDGLPLRDGRRGVARLRYRFTPGSEWRESFGATGYSNGQDALTFAGDLAAQGEADVWRRAVTRGAPVMAWGDYLRGRAAEIRNLALAYPARDDTVLQVGDMSEPHLHMQTCTHELWRQWGYDPAAIATYRSLPKILNGEQIGAALLRDMQRMGLRQNDQVQFRLDVDERGRATGCVIQHPRRENAVAGLICDVVVSIVRIEPALDAAGAPVRAPLVERVAFGVGP